MEFFVMDGEDPNGLGIYTGDPAEQECRLCEYRRANIPVGISFEIRYWHLTVWRLSLHVFNGLKNRKFIFLKSVNRRLFYHHSRFVFFPEFTHGHRLIHNRRHDRLTNADSPTNDIISNLNCSNKY